MIARTPIAILLSLAGAAHAQTYSWSTPVGGSWTDAANWSPAIIPNANTHIAQVAVPGPYSISLASTVTVQGLTISNPFAALDLQPGGHLHIRQDGLFTSGTIRAAGTSASFADITFDLPATLGGGGTIILDAVQNHIDSSIIGPSGAGYTIAPGFTIRGDGLLLGNKINNGLILADSAGGLALELQGITTNNAVIKAIAPGRLSMPNTVVTQSATGEITADGGIVQMSFGNISGGKIRSINGGAWNFAPGTTINLSNVTIEGPVNIRGGAAVQVPTQNLTVLGTLIVNSNQSTSATLTWTTAGTLNGPGTVLLNGPLTTNAGINGGGFLLTIGANASIAGTGRFIGNTLIANGRIAPGPIDGGIGSISFNQSLNLQLAKIDLEVAGPDASQVDTLIGTGSIDLHGILRINTRDGFAPAMGLDLEIIRGATMTGAFDEVHLPSPVNGVGFTLRRIGPSIHLQTKCYANCDESTASPILNINDFQCFLGIFAAGFNAANCDGSTSAPVLNVNDFNCFLNVFAAGCS